MLPDGPARRGLYRPVENNHRGVLQAKLESAARQQRTEHENKIQDAQREAEEAEKAARRVAARAKRLREQAVPWR